MTEWEDSRKRIRVKQYCICPKCGLKMQPPLKPQEEYIPFHTWIQNEYNRLKKIRKDVYIVTNKQNPSLISIFTTPIKKKFLDKDGNVFYI